jgi:nitrate reductase gamma subunit
MAVFLWVIVPYVCLAVFVVGHVWRYRYDKFGWTTRSSQLYEDRLLRIGSPLFHFGMLEPELMTLAPLGSQLHALLAFLLFAMWPFTRLVHAFSAPIGYLTRPYLVYRSKDERPGRGSGNRAPQRGWDKPELTKK